jgi:cation:H+ antiporter
MYIELAIGFFLLWVGGELLVRGSISIARRFHLSQLLIGVSIVAFGTSAPELVFSIKAAYSGATGLAVGNVVGSNIANLLLVLGIAAFLMPIACDPRALFRDVGALVGATLLFSGIALSGEIGPFTGAVFICLLIGYLVFSYRRERQEGGPSRELHELEAEELSPTTYSFALAVPMLLGGLLGLAFGADFLVRGALGIAEYFQVPQEVIGITMIAIGTSLPEIAASAVAAFHRHTEVALGNIVGSNIFNILGVTGAAAMVRTLPIPEGILQFNLWVMLAITALFVPLVFRPLLFPNTRVGRIEGSVLISLYCGYIVMQFTSLPSLP